MRLEFSQQLSADIQTVWSFFSDPYNLPHITPPWLGFRIASAPPHSVHTGLVIDYLVSPILRIPMKWRSEITVVEPPYRFIDEQRIGPYKTWHHEHLFEAQGNSTIVRDIITYDFAFWPINQLLNPILIEPRIRKIFEFRREAITQLVVG